VSEALPPSPPHMRGRREGKRIDYKKKWLKGMKQATKEKETRNGLDHSLKSRKKKRKTPDQGGKNPVI